MRRLLGSLLACLIVATAHADPTAMAPFTLGTGTHFGQARGDVDRLFAAIAEAGLQSFRDEIFWHEVEQRRRDYRLPDRNSAIMRGLALARERGIEPLLILCYGNSLYAEPYPVSDDAQEAFARYAEFMARSLKGMVRYFEVWNEWNGGLGGGSQGAAARTPDQYVRLLQRAHAAIKRGNPDAVVIGGAVEGAGGAALRWIDRMLELDGARYMDALSVHPYLHHGGPDANPERLVGWFAALAEIFRRRGIAPDFPVLVTEIGWPTHSGPLGLSEDRAADYLARTLLLLRSFPAVRGVWWYNLQNDGPDPAAIEENFGLLAADFRAKPGYRALGRLTGILTEARGIRRLPSPGHIWAVRLDEVQGRSIIAIWTSARRSLAVDLDLVMRHDAEAIVESVGGGSGSLGSRRVAPGRQLFRVQASGTPVIVDLPAAAVESVAVAER